MTLLGGPRLDRSKLFSEKDSRRRPSSIDLTIGSMLDSKGTDLGAEHSLMPGEMVFVVSKEVFTLPDNITGFVSCKTSLTHDGVWAITVGIVDPCYVGPIATSLVNFGRNARALTRDMPFLRVAFFEHEAHEKCKEKNVPDEIVAYNLSAKQMAVRFPPRFLNQDELAKTAVEQTWGKMLIYAGLWGAFVAVLFSALQVASVAVDRFIFSPDLVTPPTERVEILEGRVDRLEEELRRQPREGVSRQP